MLFHADISQRINPTAEHVKENGKSVLQGKGPRDDSSDSVQDSWGQWLQNESGVS